MLTDKEMLQIAEKFLKKIGEESNKELMMYLEDTIKKPYGNIYFFNSKKYILTGDINYALGGNGPFLVEKETGRVITFGTAYQDEYYIKSYENGTFIPALYGIWDYKTGKYIDKNGKPIEDDF